MSKVAVSKRVLLWAVERGGRTLKDLEQKYPKIADWVSGEEMPTLKQLESLAKATRTPLGFFFLKDPPTEQLPIPYFRTIDGRSLHRPSSDLIETVQLMQQRQVWMREYLIDQGTESLRFVNSASLRNRPQETAEMMRAILGFELDWASQLGTWTDALQTLREAIETAGVMVIVSGIVENNTHRKLSVDEFRGFVLVDDFAPLVFVNGVDGKAAQMFTLAHELAHVVTGSSAAFDLRQLQPADDPVEIACNKIAAEFLVPETQLRTFWNSARVFSDPFQSIAHHFKVSTLVAARRALDLGLISRKVFLEFYEVYRQRERTAAASRGPGGNFYANQNLRIGKSFARAVAQATREGRLLYRDAYHLTGLYGSTFERYSETLLSERLGR